MKYESIPLLIKELMSVKNITQIQMANELNTTRQTVKNYLLNRTKIDIQTLIRISEILNVDISIFFRNEDVTLNKVEEVPEIYHKGNIFNIDSLSYTNNTLKRILEILEEKL